MFIVGGAVAIAVGGDVTVDAAARIAGDLGMSQTLIGLTIVSIGTSLPELVTSIVAARKNEVDMALGNAIGSNIFNILMVLGIASAISPMAIITENIIDLCVLIVFTVCVWIFAGTKKKIGRVEVSVWSHFMPHMHLYHYKIRGMENGVISKGVSYRVHRRDGR